MNQDPIVEEIHDIREQLLQECGGDLTQLMARLKAEEAQDKARLIKMRGRKKGPEKGARLDLLR
jgi:hypothetical protein